MTAMLGPPTAGAPALPLPPLLVAEDLLELSVVAAFSGRAGSGRLSYESCNLGLHVGDDIRTVLHNRHRVATVLGLAGLPWATVHQVHAAKVISANRQQLGPGPPETKPRLGEADGLVTTEAGLVLVVFAADCVPLLLADPENHVVGAVHAGWRGLAAGAVEAGIAALTAAGADPAATIALLGPAIGACCYEVGPDVAATVTDRYPAAAATTRDGRPAIDTAGAVRQALDRAGISRIRQAGECTYHHPDRYFSYRRDGHTGHQAGIIAMSPTTPS